MDTVTHIVLGSVTGELLGRRELGRKALVVGAAANLFPDIDVVAALWLDPADNVIFHRGITHSIFANVIFALAFSWVIVRYRKTPERWGFWLWFLMAEFFLHLFVDVFNAYGAGLLEPFVNEKISFHSIYVVDPLLTIWLLIGTVLLFFLRSAGVRRKVAVVSLALSGLYLASAITGRVIVNKAIRSELAERDIRYDRLLITPTPLNSWLWFTAAETAEGYQLNYVSVFHPESIGAFYFASKGEDFIHEIDDTATFNKLSEFSDGFYTLSKQDGQLVFNNLCFGQIAGWRDPTAGFAFHYYLDGSGDNTYVMQRGRFSNWDRQTVDVLMQRTFRGN